MLARILDDAVRDRLLAVNPARGVKLPQRAPRHNVYLSATQLQALADESGRYQSLVLLLGVVGLRWGEAAALRVSDVDFLRRRVDLHRNAVQVGRQIVVGSLKSNKSRTVVLPTFVIDALAQTANGKGRDDLLWSSSSGGHLGATGFEQLLAVRCRAAVPEGRYDVPPGHRPRPAAYSGLAGQSAGANPKVVKRMLGHASAATTLDVYADLFDSDLASVAESVGNLWARGQGQPG